MVSTVSEDTSGDDVTLKQVAEQLGLEKRDSQDWEDLELFSCVNCDSYTLKGFWPKNPGYHRPGHCGEHMKLETNYERVLEQEVAG